MKIPYVDAKTNKEHLCEQLINIDSSFPTLKEKKRRNVYL